MSRQKKAAAPGAGKFTPGMNSDVLLLRGLIPSVLFAVLHFLGRPEDADTTVSEMDARSIAALVDNYNEWRVEINKTIDATGALCEVGGITILRYEWGYSFEHDEYVRMLVVPDMFEHDGGLELKELRPQDVGCAFHITLPKEGVPL